MKIVGLLCILLGSVLLGLRYGWELELKLEERKTLLRLIALLKGEIRFGNSSLPECFYRIGKGKDGPYGEVLLKVYEEAKENKGESFYTLLEKYFRNGEDKELFLGCFQNSSEDGRGILERLERTEEQLIQKNLELEQELGKRKKLGLSLGTMGGLMGILLFL